MPFYEYQCKSCHHQFEAMQKVSDPLLTVCPQCQKPDLSKLVSSPAFQLKGTGWYVTDFKNKETKPKTAEKPAEKTENTTSTTSTSNTSTDKK